MSAVTIGVDGREFRAGARTGIRSYLVEVLRAASRAGWRPIVYGDSTTVLDVDLPGVTLDVLPGRWTQWWDQVRLPAALAEDRVAIFLSPFYKGPLRAPCPVVLTIHDLFFIGYPGRPRAIVDAARIVAARLYARRAAAIIADSEHSRRSIVARLGVPDSKVTAIPVAVGAGFAPQPLTDAIRARYLLDGPYVLYVGNFKPHKNLPRLIRAYSALPGHLRERYALVLAGGDRANRGALERLATERGVDSRIVFPGPIDDADLPALYSAAALFVLPSLEEGFGLPAVEAMACGVPVVVSNRGALPEVVADAALVVDAESEPALSAAMAQVLMDTEFAAQLTRRGLERSRHFAPERTSDGVLAVLDEVLAGRH